MNSVLRVLFSLDVFMVGVLLMLLPWLGLWEHNYFLDRYPSLIPFLLHPSVRGAITGLGVLDILIAADMLRRRPNSVATPN